MPVWFWVCEEGKYLKGYQHFGDWKLHTPSPTYRSRSFIQLHRLCFCAEKISSILPPYLIPPLVTMKIRVKVNRRRKEELLTFLFGNAILFSVGFFFFPLNSVGSWLLITHNTWIYTSNVPRRQYNTKSWKQVSNWNACV